MSNLFSAIFMLVFGAFYKHHQSYNMQRFCVLRIYSQKNKPTSGKANLQKATQTYLFTYITANHQMTNDGRIYSKGSIVPVNKTNQHRKSTEIFPKIAVTS